MNFEDTKTCSKCMKQISDLVARFAIFDPCENIHFVIEYLDVLQTFGVFHLKISGVCVLW